MTHLRVRVVRPSEVGLVVFSEALATNGVLVVIVENAASAVIGHVDAMLVAHIRQVKAANDV